MREAATARLGAIVMLEGMAGHWRECAIDIRASSSFAAGQHRRESELLLRCGLARQPGELQVCRGPAQPTLELELRRGPAPPAWRAGEARGQGGG